MIPVMASLLMIAAVALWYLDPIRGFGGDRVFPVSLQSSIFADYGSDLDQQQKLPPVSLNMIAEVIRDIRDSIDAGKILRQLETPVQTVTPFSSSPTAIFQTITIGPISPSNTSKPPSTEQIETPTSTPTQRGNFGRTLTPTATAGTNTPISASGTVMPTPTATNRSHRTLEPTHTITFTLQPSLTFTPFSTPTPLPATVTQLPATNTAQPTGYPAPSTPTPQPTAMPTAIPTVIPTLAPSATPVIGYP